MHHKTAPAEQDLPRESTEELFGEICIILKEHPEEFHEATMETLDALHPNCHTQLILSTRDMKMYQSTLEYFTEVCG
jgi:hypothetical protein